MNKHTIPAIIVIILSCTILYFLIPQEPETIMEEVTVIDKGCLTNIANVLCKEFDSMTEYSTSVTETQFSCIKESDPRQKSKTLTGTYYFLDNEISNCSTTKLREVKK